MLLNEAVEVLQYRSIGQFLVGCFQLGMTALDTWESSNTRGHGKLTKGRVASLQTTASQCATVMNIMAWHQPANLCVGEVRNIPSCNGCHAELKSGLPTTGTLGKRMLLVMRNTFNAVSNFV